MSNEKDIGWADLFWHSAVIASAIVGLSLTMILYVVPSLDRIATALEQRATQEVRGE